MTKIKTHMMLGLMITSFLLGVSNTTTMGGLNKEILEEVGISKEKSVESTWGENEWALLVIGIVAACLSIWAYRNDKDHKKTRFPRA